MIKTKWIAIPALTAVFVFAGAVQGSSVKAADNVAAMQDMSSKGGKGHAKGHAKGRALGLKLGHGKKWHGHYAYKSRGANNPYFCPPGQAKKPGLGSAHMC